MKKITPSEMKKQALKELLRGKVLSKEKSLAFGGGGFAPPNGLGEASITPPPHGAGWR